MNPLMSLMITDSIRALFSSTLSQLPTIQE